MKQREVMRCLSRLETETARLYLNLYDKCVDTETASILLFIALDSMKHSRIFSHFAGPVRRTGLSRCTELLGKAYRDSYSMIRMLRKRVMASGDLGRTEMIEILDKLVDYEANLGEEYLTLLYSKTLSYLPEYKEYRKALELIAEDEERHTRLVEDALKLIARAGRCLHE